MPKHSQAIKLSAEEASAPLPIAYGTLIQLCWTVKHATDNTIVAYTTRDWKRNENEIIIEAANDQLTVTSKMVHGELSDLMGHTQKDIAEFMAAFETIKAGSSPEQIAGWTEIITGLRADTTEVVEKETQEAIKFDKTMNLSKGNMHVSFVIIGLNVLVFILMALGGVNVFSPGADDIVKWGGNIAALTTSGEWWRLITNVFVHIGIFHLLFNMYGFYFVGAYLEPVLGKTRFIAAYLCTGVLASLVSLWWYRSGNNVSAGASGAIFGMYGLFLALLTTHLIPGSVRKAMIQSTVVFVGYNLFYGMKAGVDNSAHVGGLLSGMIIGYVYYFFTLRGEIPAIKKNRTALALVISTAVICFFAVSNIKTTQSTFVSNKQMLNFEMLIQRFDSLESEALAVYEESNTMTKKGYVEKLKNVSLKNWQEARGLFESSEVINFPPRVQLLCKDLVEYCTLNEKKTGILIKIFSENTPDYNNELNKTDEEIEKMMEKIQSDLHEKS